MAYLAELAASLQKEIESINYGDRREELIDRLARVNLAIGSGNSGGALRAAAVKVDQVINASGSVVKITYTLQSGATIQDDYVYGPNSTTEPSGVTFGSVINYSPSTTPIAVTLGSFTVGANGTSINYVATPGPVTSVTGFITVSGIDYPLTYISSGSASIDTPIRSGAIATVTISASTPTLSALVTGAAVTNGSTIAPLTLSGFAVASNGTSLVYTATGGAITALTGTVNGIAFTHNSNGSATLATPLLQGVAATITITGSAPILSTAVNGVALVNNSTVATPALSRTGLTWSTTNGGSQTGNVLTLANTGNGSIATQTIDPTQAFEVVGIYSTFAISGAMVMYLDDDAGTDYSWSATNVFRLGAYASNGGAIATTEIGGANLTNRANTIAPVQVKIAKSGLDLVASSSIDGGATWVVERTKVGALTALTTLYLKVLSASGSNKTLDVGLYR